MEILNRKARYDYFVEDTYETGISLMGTEIKSIRQGSANFNDSYAIIKRGEINLINMFISVYSEGNRFNHNETRTRKLLMHKSEIKKLESKITQEGYTLVPLKLYFKNNKAKVLLGMAKGKKNYDKRETLKQRDQERDLKKMAKDSYR
jgi:SsrA-binding protein